MLLHNVNHPRFETVCHVNPFATGIKMTGETMVGRLKGTNITGATAALKSAADGALASKCHTNTPTRTSNRGSTIPSTHASQHLAWAFLVRQYRVNVVRQDWETARSQHRAIEGTQLWAQVSREKPIPCHCETPKPSDRGNPAQRDFGIPKLSETLRGRSALSSSVLGMPVPREFLEVWAARTWEHTNLVIRPQERLQWLEGGLEPRGLEHIRSIGANNIVNPGNIPSQTETRVSAPTAFRLFRKVRLWLST